MATTYDGTGHLQVWAVTARGALPVEGAVVTVAGADPRTRDLRITQTTYNVGKTEELPLPAPAASLSLVPGNMTPYATYDITVEKDGYYLHQALNVPVFDRVVSVQTAEMIPRSYTGGAAEVPKVVDITNENMPFLGGSGK